MLVDCIRFSRVNVKSLLATVTSLGRARCASALGVTLVANEAVRLVTVVFDVLSDGRNGKANSRDNRGDQDTRRVSRTERVTGYKPNRYLQNLTLADWNSS